jgi:hypothetical protein
VNDTTAPPMLGLHQMVAVYNGAWRCTACGIAATRRHNPRSPYGIRLWVDWRAPDDRTWMTVPGEEAPSCPPPAVEALCPWLDSAMRYAGPKGDVQLDTAMRTWCETHQCAVSECPEPGPYCPGAAAHSDGEEGYPGPCTGRENSCRCMCPACCGDTPDMYGYDGDH